MTVSGGFGVSVSRTTNTNGYFNFLITPTVIGGPYTLQYSVNSPQGNYSTNQNSLIVTAPLIIPVDKILQGVTIAGRVGTMPNMATSNPNGIGVGRSQAKEYWTGGGSTLFLKPQRGYFDGVDTWTYWNEPNLLPSNIKSGTSIFGVEGNMPPGKRSLSMNFIYDTYPVKNPVLNFTVPNVNFTPFLVYADFSSSGSVNGTGGGSGPSGTYLGSVSNLSKGEMHAASNHVDFYLSFSMSGTNCNVSITANQTFTLDRGNVTIYLFE
ncbi:hypothetical protein Desde_3167 [Desulfitobacterium dehalogenans ATCC 51507]|uniref:Uncharacterized protein n=1 Tax=Desulfitobacterium dehalogenans (strain ATCC 51507 / DSM 9161 / JW/IU-DC1) TaxID=756499 RepID=I4ABX3_DESDJ|nr:hypothetical protein Desde_3167 [Desulfitobacterium dehalogenans ATCC 51507]